MQEKNESEIQEVFERGVRLLGVAIVHGNGFSFQ